MKSAGRVGGFLYKVARILFSVLFSLICPIDCIEVSSIKAAEGPCIIISDHNSYLDPLILVWLCPKQMRFLVKKELMENAFLAWCIRMTRCIPIDRESRDMKAFRECITALGEGAVLGVFPEGTRHAGGRMEDPKTGTAMMALMKGADIIPVYIDGKPRPFRKTRVISGRTIGREERPSGPISAGNVALMNDLIKERYSTLRKELNVE